MKVAIAGAGMAGAYLYRLLREQGITAHIYDANEPTSCGITSCGWGAVPTVEVQRLISRFLEPSDYELQRFREINIEGVKIKGDMLTIDKPRLIKDLLDGAEVRFDPLDTGMYDRIIDATGVVRAFLGPSTIPPLLADCTQYRVRTDQPKELSIKISSLGYEWCFPLSDNEYHMGFGNLHGDAEGYTLPTDIMAEVSVCCNCRAKVCLSSPEGTQPFVVGKVVGVGESIGAVAPLAADGIVYAMQTGELLIERWDDPNAYAREVLRRYDWMNLERRGLNRLIEGRMPLLEELRAFLKHTRMAGFDMRMRHAMYFFRRMLKAASARNARPQQTA